MSFLYDPRRPLLAGIILGILVLYAILFCVWTVVAVGPKLMDWLSAAGSLNACIERGLTPDECTAYAQEEAQP